MSRFNLSADDVFALVGLGLLTIGALLIWLPLGFVVPGVLLLTYAIWPRGVVP